MDAQSIVQNKLGFNPTILPVIGLDVITGRIVPNPDLEVQNVVHPAPTLLGVTVRVRTPVLMLPVVIVRDRAVGMKGVHPKEVPVHSPVLVLLHPEDPKVHPAEDLISDPTTAKIEILPDVLILEKEDPDRILEMAIVPTADLHDRIDPDRMLLDTTLGAQRIPVRGMRRNFQIVPIFLHDRM